MKTLKQQLIALSLLTLSLSGLAQSTTEGVSIKSSVAPPHPSAMLDVDNSSKGVLIPRVILASVTNSLSPIFHPADGLFVYHTDNSTLSGKGFYYWNQINSTSGQWIKLGETAGKMTQVTFQGMMDLIANSGFQDEDRGLMVYCTTKEVAMINSEIVTSSRVCTGDGTGYMYHTKGIWYLTKEEICSGQPEVFMWKYIDNLPRGIQGAATTPGAVYNCQSGPCALQN